MKSSSGASEYLPIFEYTDVYKFVMQSKENGWKFYAAGPPPFPGEGSEPLHPRYLEETAVGLALLQGPCCAILGHEGDGLRPFLAKMANYRVGIKRGIGTDSVVDSLNVVSRYPFKYSLLLANDLSYPTRFLSQQLYYAIGS